MVHNHFSRAQVESRDRQFKTQNSRRHGETEPQGRGNTGIEKRCE